MSSPVQATQAQVDANVKALDQRHDAYKVAFSGAPGTYVLEDLAKFCRAHESTFHEDARMHAVLEGRREVWLRIQNAMGLIGEELFALYAPPVLTIMKERTDE